MSNKITDRAADTNYRGVCCSTLLAQKDRKIELLTKDNARVNALFAASTKELNGLRHNNASKAREISRLEAESAGRLATNVQFVKDSIAHHDEVQRLRVINKEKDTTIAKLRDDLTAADLVGGDLVFQLAEKHQEIQRLNGIIGQQKAVILKMERARDTSGVEDPEFNIHDGLWCFTYSTKLFGPQGVVSGPKAVAWP